MNVECYKLGDLCSITSSKRIFAHQYVSKGIPFYRSKEIIEKSEKKEISEPLYISEDVYNEIKDKFGVPQKGDMLLTSVGTLGIPYVVDDEKFYFKDGNLTWFKKFSEQLNSKYLYYWLKSKFGYDSLIARAIGASQGALTIDILKKYKVLIPNIQCQNKIVDILSKYDLLIENNNSKIKNLEDLAKQLYKEWFVHFRFPGYGNVDFYEGIPTIWKYEKIGDIMTFDRGISYSSEEIDCDEGLNLINLKNIQSFGGFRRSGTKKYNGKYKKSQVVKENDLIMGVTDMTQERRTVGSVALIPDMKGISVISADLVKVNSDIDNVFLYTMFRFGNISKYLSQFGNGANVIHLKPDTIKNKKILVPDSDTIKAFTDMIKPIIAQLNNLNNQNDNLTEQRDLLLPRLMSGKLELK